MASDVELLGGGRGMHLHPLCIIATHEQIVTRTTLASGNPPEIKNQPSDEFSKALVRAYLETRAKLREGPKDGVTSGESTCDITDEVVDTWYKHALKCTVVSSSNKVLLFLSWGPFPETFLKRACKFAQTAEGKDAQFKMKT